MPTYTVTDGNQNTISQVAPNSLKQFLDECETYAELRREDWPGQAIVARPTDDHWQLEIIDGGRRQVATTPNTDATLDAMRAWAEQDDWLQEAFTWRPVGPAA